MNTHLKVDQVPAELRECDAAVVKDIMNVNHRPHPLMVDSQLVVYAADHCGGLLGEQAIDAVGCGWRGAGGNHGPRCGQRAAAHTCDTVLVVRLKRDASRAELHPFLLSLKPWLEANQVDGFVFLEGHRIT